MGTRIVLHTVTGLFISFILTSHLINVTQGSKVWGEVAFPEDLEAERAGALDPAQTDDEDFAADEASGDLPSGDEDGSTPEPTRLQVSAPRIQPAPPNTPSPHLAPHLLHSPEPGAAPSLTSYRKWCQHT
ncbi:hypothetical protein ANANG_G00220040 [Anguilla anguilla]|uniref:Uncharacterized protein n=1 Tax=Anguilla anguilla TaxID=7936 RepID=A0A9D3LW43_ANGAN|nr:hypothetical protein ANANG_G00220040 [Anguilla anguilla]